MTMKVTSQPAGVDMLILGAGWTGTFLIPLLQASKITYAATTTDGRDGTYKFRYQPKHGGYASSTETDLDQYLALPSAKTVVIVFPLKGESESKHLTSSFIKTHHGPTEPHFIQLGSSGIFSIPEQTQWVTRHSSYDKANARAIAEDELIALGGSILNLSGLWGGTRHPKNWVSRIAKDKEQLKAKKSLHLIHGEDVARAIVAVSNDWEKAKAQRWLLTDMMVYDWYALILGFGKETEEAGGWVQELMEEEGVRALPRNMETLGRCYDTREFWRTFGISPTQAGV